MFLYPVHPLFGELRRVERTVEKSDKQIYLMGAFSTYTQWASFYGQVPLLHFHAENEVVALERFQVSDLNSWPIA